MKFVVKRSIKGFITDSVIDNRPDEEGPDFMKKINTFNWSYYLQSLDGKSVEILNDFDNLIINIRLKEMEEGTFKGPFIHLPDFMIDTRNFLVF